MNEGEVRLYEMSPLEREVRRLAAEIKGEWVEARRDLTAYLRLVGDVIDIQNDEDVRRLKREVVNLSINREWAWRELVRAAGDDDESAELQARWLLRDSRRRSRRLMDGCVALRKRADKANEVLVRLPEDAPSLTKKSDKWRGVKPEILGFLDELDEFLAASYGYEEQAAVKARFPGAAKARLQIEQNGEIVNADAWIFRSWDGPRFVNAMPYEGPVYGFGSAIRQAGGVNDGSA